MNERIFYSRSAHFKLVVINSATSDAKGPVYLWAKREVMEEELDEGFADSLMKRHPRKSVEPIALSPTGKH